MKKVLLVTASLIALGATAPAVAADLAARPYNKAPAMIASVYDWSGFYVGANGGYASSQKCWSEATFGAEGCHDATGGTVGGQVGYRMQSGAFVFGIEGQGNWADLRGSNASTTFAGITNESRVDAFGLITGQVGYAMNNALLYVKGGAAVTDDRFRSFFTGTNVLARSTGDDTRWGGVVGVGVEYGFTPNWSAAIEYDHMFMQDRTYTFVTPAGAFAGTDRIRQDVDLVTVRVNYRFGGPVVARY